MTTTTPSPDRPGWLKKLTPEERAFYDAIPVADDPTPEESEESEVQPLLRRPPPRP